MEVFASSQILAATYRLCAGVSRAAHGRPAKIRAKEIVKFSVLVWPQSDKDMS